MHANQPPWPELSDEVRTRLLATDDAFAEHIRRRASDLGHRAYSRDVLHHATSYPFGSLASPLVMVGPDPWPLVSWGSTDARDCRVLHRREAVPLVTVAPPMALESPRFPLISYGSNASLDGLARKFHHARGADRVTPVITGTLAGYDVGPSAHFSAYGAMPATLFRSEGVASRVAVTWVTGSQLGLLAETEVNYRLGWLDPVRFSPDIDSAAVTGAFVFISRHGVFGNASTPFCLEAITATGRTSLALSQREVLDEAAKVVLGDWARAQDVVRRATEDYVWAVTEAVSLLRTRAASRRDDSWHDFG